MTRLEIRNAIKTMIGRNFSGIDTVLNEYIDTSIELFSSVVSAVYDEQEWEHIVTTAGVTAKTEAYTLPELTKQILDVFYLDESGEEFVYYPISIISPVELDEVRRRGIFASSSMSAGSIYDYTSRDITLPGYSANEAGRVDTPGIPKVCARKGSRLFVYPRPGEQEVGNKIRIFINAKPAKLTTDSGAGSTNTITDNYPRALMLYTIALFWSLYLRDLQTGQQWLSQAINAIQSFAKSDELAKLSNAVLKIGK